MTARPASSVHQFTPALCFPELNDSKTFLNAPSFPLPASQLVFTNPILPAPSADPWVVRHEGAYYYCGSRQGTEIHLRHSDSIITLGSSPPIELWRAPAAGKNCKEIWAPELHRIRGKWFIYYAASNGSNRHHRMWVLESQTDDPLGPYIDRGPLDTGGWAIDGTPLLTESGDLFFIWSGWPGRTNGRQNLYIAPMNDPAKLAGERTLICSPDQPWEISGMPIAEGPQILRRNGRLFIVYSASGSWTADYCLGLLIHRPGTPLIDPASWIKQGPVFEKVPHAWGVGHCSFVQSPDGAEDWILYHAKSKEKHGWADRQVHAQPFTWSEQGLPLFGAPIVAGVPLPAPSSNAPRRLPGEQDAS